MSFKRLLRLSCLPAALAILACSPKPAPASDDDLTATVPADAAQSEAAALERSENLSREAFMDRCREGDLPSLAGVPASSTQCSAAFARATGAREAAGVLSVAFGPNGAASATSLGDIRSRLPQIDWTDAETGGSTLASGKLGDFAAAVTQRNRRQYLSFNWNGPAGNVPVDIADAMVLNGAKLDLVACQNDGTDEAGQVWRVTPERGDAFDLTTFTRMGPSGTAMSYHSGVVALDRNIATLDSLRTEDSGWKDCG